MEEIGHTSNKATDGSGSTPAYFPGREEKALVYVATKRRGQENTGRVPSILEIATDEAKIGRKLAKPMKRGQMRTGLRKGSSGVDQYDTPGYQGIVQAKPGVQEMEIETSGGVSLEPLWTNRHQWHQERDMEMEVVTTAMKEGEDKPEPKEEDLLVRLSELTVIPQKTEPGEGIDTGQEGRQEESKMTLELGEVCMMTEENEALPQRLRTRPRRVHCEEVQGESGQESEYFTAPEDGIDELRTEITETRSEPMDDSGTVELEPPTEMEGPAPVARVLRVNMFHRSEHRKEAGKGNEHFDPWKKWKYENKRVPVPFSAPQTHAMIRVSGRDIRALLDTGAEISIMSEQYWRENCQDTSARPAEDLLAKFGSTLLKGLSGTYMEGSGCVTLPVEYPGVRASLEVPFLLLKTETGTGWEDHPVLIGANVLRVVNQLQNEEVVVGSSTQEEEPSVIEVLTIAALGSLPAPTAPVQIYLCNQVVLGPGQGQQVKARLKMKDVEKSRGKGEHLVVVESIPEDHEEDEMRRLLGAKVLPGTLSLEAGQKEVTVDLYNDTNTTCKMNRGRAIGQLTPAVEIKGPEDPDEKEGGISRREGPHPIDRLGSLGEDAPPELTALLIEYGDVFSRGDTDIGRSRIMEHSIRLNSSEPIKQKPRPLAPHQTEIVRQELRDLLQAGVIRPSNSQYSSNIVLVAKANGKLRMCVDYRQLNAITIKDPYHIPDISECMNAMQGADCYSILDIKAGFYNVLMAQDSIEYTAFTAGILGMYEFLRMPFGISNGPPQMQRLMTSVMGQDLGQGIIVYLDDIVVYGKRCEKMNRLRSLFQRLRESELKLAPEKSKLYQKSIECLGFVVDAEGVRPSPKKIEAVKCWPEPKDLKQLHRFLGFSGFMRKHIKDYAKISRPLTQLFQGHGYKKGKKMETTAQAAPWQWGKDQQEAFDEIRTRLCTAPVLALPRLGEDLIMHTDASTTAFGAVLRQEQEDLTIRVIGYASKTCNQAQAAYHATKLEFYALYWAVNLSIFNSYVKLAPLTVVYTDSSPLVFMRSTMKLNQNTARWALEMAECQLEIRFKCGRENVLADGLSRITVVPSEEVKCALQGPAKDGLGVIASVVIHPRIADAFPTDLGESERTGMTPDWMKLQSQCPDLGFIQRALKKGIKPEKGKEMTDGQRSWLKHWDRLCLNEGLVYRSAEIFEKEVLQLCIPCVKLSWWPTLVIREVHDYLGHQGYDRTLAMMRDRVFFPGMSAFVQRYVDMCRTCRVANGKVTEFAAPLQPIRTTRPFELWHMDYLTLELRGTPKDVIIFTDHYSSLVFAKQTRNQKARAAAEAFMELVVSIFGFPERLMSDQGQNFMSIMLKEVKELGDVASSKTTPYHPQSNGKCERQNSVIIRILRTLEEEKRDQWPKYLRAATFLYNATKNHRTGYSPFEIVFGRPVRLAVDQWFPEVQKTRPLPTEKWVADLRGRLSYVWEVVCTRQAEARAKYKKYHDSKVPKTRRPLRVGDLCLLRNYRAKSEGKLTPRYHDETYVIVRKGADPDAPIRYIKRADGGERGKERCVHLNHLQGPLLGEEEITGVVEDVPVPKEPILENPEPRRSSRLTEKREKDQSRTKTKQLSGAAKGKTSQGKSTGKRPTEEGVSTRARTKASKTRITQMEGRVTRTDEANREKEDKEDGTPIWNQRPEDKNDVNAGPLWKMSRKTGLRRFRKESIRSVRPRRTERDLLESTNTGSKWTRREKAVPLQRTSRTTKAGIAGRTERGRSLRARVLPQGKAVGKENGVGRAKDRPIWENGMEQDGRTKRFKARQLSSTEVSEEESTEDWAGKNKAGKNKGLETRAAVLVDLRRDNPRKRLSPAHSFSGSLITSEEDEAKGLGISRKVEIGGEEEREASQRKASLPRKKGRREADIENKGEEPRRRGRPPKRGKSGETIPNLRIGQGAPNPRTAQGIEEGSRRRSARLRGIRTEGPLKPDGLTGLSMRQGTGSGTQAESDNSDVTGLRQFDTSDEEPLSQKRARLRMLGSESRNAEIRKSQSDTATEEEEQEVGVVGESESEAADDQVAEERGQREEEEFGEGLKGDAEETEPAMETDEQETEDDSFVQARESWEATPPKRLAERKGQIEDDPNEGTLSETETLVTEEELSRRSEMTSVSETEDPSRRHEPPVQVTGSPREGATGGIPVTVQGRRGESLEGSSSRMLAWSGVDDLRHRREMSQAPARTRHSSEEGSGRDERRIETRTLPGPVDRGKASGSEQEEKRRETKGPVVYPRRSGRQPPGSKKGDG